MRSDPDHGNSAMFRIVHNMGLSTASYTPEYTLVKQSRDFNPDNHQLMYASVMSHQILFSMYMEYPDPEVHESSRDNYIRALMIDHGHERGPAERCYDALLKAFQVMHAAIFYMDSYYAEGIRRSSTSEYPILEFLTHWLADRELVHDPAAYRVFKDYIAYNKYSFHLGIATEFDDDYVFETIVTYLYYQLECPAAMIEFLTNRNFELYDKYELMPWLKSD